MKAKEIVESLLEFYSRNVGSGHTRLMMDGVREYDGLKGVLFHNKDYADQLKIDLRSRFNRVYSLSDLKYLKTTKIPLAIDNAAMVKIFEIINEGMCKKDKQIHDLKAKIEDLTK